MSECVLGKQGTRRWYIRIFGPLPSHIHVLHHCDQPNCRNPEHIFLGTQSDNTKDAVAKGRWTQVKKKRQPLTAEHKKKQSLALTGNQHKDRVYL